MIDVNPRELHFMNSVKNAIKEANLLMRIRTAVDAEELARHFEQYLIKNQFRQTLNLVSDKVYLHLQNIIFHHYRDSDYRVFKYPEYGVRDDFGFSIVGNAEYEQAAIDRQLDKGTIYTSKDKRLIPTPYEEARGRELLFRTSHGQIIKGDPFIDEHLSEQMNLHSPMILNAYHADARNFLRGI